MARKPEVTRHITYTQCVCRCVDIKSERIFGKTVNLTRIVNSRQQRFNKCRQVVEATGYHLLQVESYKYLQSFASQTEIQFLENATILETVEITLGKDANKGKEN